ncbi:hypothetical protein F6X40_35425 [Paraburkholderia sp. UCT31]|uniref:hypothetical protein n=1 Tax=Paraburkholderia sp. UCT31 TaxID=2615209 RepID=UPI0016550F10|nr:hypothetical protein [Paraburkholderia sp. UCT31]MBC8741842.1 hypothetical protein [Paraburkholderia sp. UCT31]
MKFKELFTLAASGAPVVVECKDEVGRWDGYAEAGMRMAIVGGRVTEPEVGQLLVDFTEFDSFNQTFESRNYYDAEGKPTRTAREAGYYKPKDAFYVDPEEDIGAFLEIIDDKRKRLIVAYAELPEPKPSYTSWLEQMVVTHVLEGND